MIIALFVGGILVNLIKLLPQSCRRRFARTIHKIGQFDPDGPISPENFLESSGTWGHVKFSVRTCVREALSGYICEGENAPNLELIYMRQNGVEKCRLLDFMQWGRPLVLNMGNCS